jgi:hypothetical protein
VGFQNLSLRVPGFQKLSFGLGCSQVQGWVLGLKKIRLGFAAEIQTQAEPKPEFQLSKYRHTGYSSQFRANWYKFWKQLDRTRVFNFSLLGNSLRLEYWRSISAKNQFPPLSQTVNGSNGWKKNPISFEHSNYAKHFSENFPFVKLQ